MIPAFVVDASIGVAWVRESQATAESDAALDSLTQGAFAIAPSFWSLEVTNALVVLRRRNKLIDSELFEAISRLNRLPIKFDTEWSDLAFETIAPLAKENNLSTYDATYLELVRRTRFPLCCKDGPLRSASMRLGLRLWTP